MICIVSYDFFMFNCVPAFPHFILTSVINVRNLKVFLQSNEKMRKWNLFEMGGKLLKCKVSPRDKRGT